MERSWKVPAGNPIEMTEEEAALAKDVRQRLESIMARVRANEEIPSTDIDEMGDVAHRLHMALKARGHEPRHHRHMLKNRRVRPTDATFYRHVHPVEDLLRFLGNEHANDDPVDATIDHEFTFDVYCRRWGNPDHYRVRRTASGWIFSHMQDVATGRDARVGGKRGTGLFQLLDHDSINYPEELPGYFEWLWEQAANRGLTHDEVQAGVKQLADWVSTCERMSPRDVFEGFK